MQRRDFLKLLGLTGMAAAIPSQLRHASADDGDHYDGPFLVCIHAGGGWDPTMLCDPRARGDYNRAYDDFGTAGAIKYAGRTLDYASYGADYTNNPSEFPRGFMSNEEFFGKYRNKLTIFNGLNTSTNNHDTGTKTVWSGRLMGQFPSLCALFAAAKAPTVPMSYLAGGGYDYADNLVPLTRARDIDPLRRILAPDVLDPTNSSGARYNHVSVAARIRATQDARARALTERATLPMERRSIGQLMLARSGTSALERLVLPESLVNFNSGTFSDVRNLMQQAQVAVSAFQAGLACSASISIGGFDTHTNNDRSQLTQLAKLLRGVDFLMETANAAGIGDKLYVVVGSDFARGPRYNADGAAGGKDHYTITSMMAMGPNLEGNRVIGSTTESQQPIGVDPVTLEPSSTGTILRPEHVHRALRSALGIPDTTTQRYALVGEDLPIFG